MNDDYKVKENVSHDFPSMYPIAVFTGRQFTINNIPPGETGIAPISSDVSANEAIINYIFTSSSNQVHVFTVEAPEANDWKVHVRNDGGGPATVTVTPVVLKIP
ncbi:hypothetical protein [Bacillus safensis]|uniref:hypothetical protein n=1 Tax=Bacillus safensis TaxID=561879 RepID=UPI0018E1AE5E|nr:hypothetical protein [Bacillus safensis]MBI1630296.1 hypothetical protein [Bacillus safensis]